MQEDFKKRLGKEYWTTSEGNKYPNELDNDSLIEAIRFLHQNIRKFRLEEARQQCELTHRIGHPTVDVNRYYDAFKKEMDTFLSDLDDKEWLKENSKIYVLLIEEAKYRELDYNIKPKSKKVKKHYTIGKIHFSA